MRMTDKVPISSISSQVKHRFSNERQMLTFETAKGRNAVLSPGQALSIRGVLTVSHQAGQLRNNSTLPMRSVGRATCRPCMVSNHLIFMPLPACRDAPSLLR